MKLTKFREGLLSPRDAPGRSFGRASVAYSVVLTLLLVGCASTYPVKTTRLKLPGLHPMMGASDPTAPTLTIFSQQQGILAMVCGAVVQYQNGEPAAVMSGNCNTPLAMVAAALGPLSLGMGAALWNNP